MLNVAWAVFLGFDPVTDFSHLYGGLLSHIIAALFAATGVSVKAFDYALIVIYATVTVLTLIVGWRRLSPLALFAAFLIVTALGFTRNPLEIGAPSISVAAHAMLYNRMGWLYLFVAFLAAFLPVRRGSELPGCAAGGIAAFLMIASKPSFVIGMVPLVIGFVLSGRRSLLVPWAIAFLLGGSAYWAVTSHGPGEWLALFQYMSDLGSRLASGSLGPELKLALIAGSNFFDIVMVLFLCGLLFARNHQHYRQVVIVALVFLAVTLGIAVTNGAFGMPFVQSPAPAMLAVVLFEAARRQRQADTTIVFVSFLAVASFALPHMLNAAASGLKENRHRLVQLEHQGVFQDYAVEPDLEPRLSLALGIEELERRTANRLEARHSINEINSQEFFLIVVNGLRALREIGGHRELGVISPYRRIFTVGLKGKPVTSYPFDPKIESPEFDDFVTLGDDVDILMILRADDSVAELRELLLAAAGDEFTLRKQTRFWDIYQRRKPARLR